MIFEFLVIITLLYSWSHIDIMPIYYCRFNSVCVSFECSFEHHHPFPQRKLLRDLIETDFPEHMALIDGFKPPKKSCACKHHIRCFEKDCPFTHCGLDLEKRKEVFKPFNRKLKSIQMQEKISKEIKERKEKSVDWNDL